MKKVGERWEVPSGSRDNKTYSVAWVTDEGQPHFKCPCDDWVERGAVLDCKHICAIEIVRAYRQDDAVEEIPRPTYSQDWHTYNLAQTNEFRHFCALAREICDVVKRPPREVSKAGRKPLPIGDIVMAAILKVYFGKSTRRARSMLPMLANGMFGELPSTAAMWRVVEDPSMTPTFSRLFEWSAAPLAGLENTLALDGTGLSLNTYAPGYRADTYSKLKPRHRGWAKLHIAVGPKTHVIAAVIGHATKSGDSPQFVKLLQNALSIGFLPKDVLADAAYCNYENIQKCVDLGITPYIPFPQGKGEGKGAPESFTDRYHFFQWHRREFLQTYSARQAVEAAIASFKKCVASTLRSRSFAAIVNEMLLIALTHNLLRIIHAMYELKVDPIFPKGEIVAGVTH